MRKPTSSVEAYAKRRKNKSIWRRSSTLAALLVVFVTAYALIFPAHTVERKLICGQREHVHDESCWLAVLSCVLEEGEEHTHDADCYENVLLCAMEEHVHTDECYAEPEPQPGDREAPGEASLLPAEEPLPAPTPVTEPLEDDLPPPPADEADEPSPLPPLEPWEEPVEEPAEEPVETTEPAAAEATEPMEPEPDEPVQPEPEATEPADCYGHDPEAVEIWGLRADGQLDYPTDEIDLAPYLDQVSFKKQVGGELVESWDFVNGDTAYATISYDIVRNIVTPTSRCVFYQLPEGIRLLEEVSGEVTDDGERVGFYTIGEDGVIHICFDESFANGNAISGTVEFACMLMANEDGSDRIIIFENDTGIVTIRVPDEQRYDLKLMKFGAFNTDYTEASFRLTVSSTKGSGHPIDLTDELFNPTPANLLSAVYRHSDLAVVHYDAQGNATPVAVSPEWAEGNMSFALRQLPALEAGERYVLTYTVEIEADLGGSFELDNQAVATSGVLSSSARYFIDYTADIRKSGAFNPDTGCIDWEILINPDRRDVSGWTIEDELPYRAKEDQIYITTANGHIFDEVTLTDGRRITYTFPQGAPIGVYYLRYSTEAPQSAETVYNSVRLINDHDITVTAEVVVRERIEGVEKSADASFPQADGLVQTTWSFSVTPPLGALESYSFYDVISQSVRNEATGEALDSTLHYGIAAELEAAFRGNLRLVADGRTYRYGDEANHYVQFTLTYLDAQGNVIPAEDAVSHVAQIRFQLTPLQGQSFQGHEIVAEGYPTWLDAGDALVNENWSYVNRVYLHGDYYQDATAFYRRSVALSKQVRTGSHYSAEAAQLVYREVGGELEYRLLLNLIAMEGEAFTVTDLLPAGVELIPGSPRAFFTGTSLFNEYPGSFAEGGSFSVQTEAREDGTTLVTFRGDGVTEAMKRLYAYVGIVYTVRLTGPDWNDYTLHTESFHNTAWWDGYTADQDVTVENTPKRLFKQGLQLLDANGNPRERLRFTLLINAGGEDLSSGSTLTLTDTLSSDIVADLEFGSVTLCHYDPTRPNGIGNPLPYSEFGMTYDMATHTMTVTVPDETPLVFVYDYTVDRTAILDGVTQVCNEAELTGGWSSSFELNLRAVTSAATAWQRSVVITKVDEHNYSRVLRGAKFLVYRWDPGMQAWNPLLEEDEQHELVFETELDGKIVLELTDCDGHIHAGILYKVVEVEPPVGYVDEQKTLYFLCNEHEGVDWQTLLARAGDGSGVTIDEVELLSYIGGSTVMTNRFEGLTVEKVWYDSNEIVLDQPDLAPITVTLYQSTDPTGETGMTRVTSEVEGFENPVQLGTDNNWEYTWGKLTPYDEEGNQLYFFVAEDPVEGCSTEYEGNGVTSGIITVSNHQEPYTLPSTGGSGVERLVLYGILLIGVATFLYSAKARQIRKQKNL